MHRDLTKIKTDINNYGKPSINSKPIINQLLRSKIRFSSSNKMFSKRRNLSQNGNKNGPQDSQFRIIQPKQRLEIYKNIEKIYSDNNLEYKRNQRLESIEDHQTMTNREYTNDMYFNEGMM